MTKNLSKVVPITDDFIQSEGSGGVTQVLNPFIFIVWIQLRVRSLRILSIGLHLALFASEAVRNNISDLHFKGGPSSPQPLVCCYVLQYLRLWIAAWQYYLLYKAPISYFRSLDARNISMSCTFAPKKRNRLFWKERQQDGKKIKCD